MATQLPRPHRLARMNYPVRVGSFGFAFAVIVLVLMERSFSVPALFLAALSFLVYPHLAFLHAKLVFDSKRAELNNLLIDSAILGLWVAQIQYAIWPSLGALLALNLNNAICGGIRHLLLGLLSFLATAVLWGGVWGLPFRPETGLPVALLCALGILAYVSALGVVFHRGNRKLVEAREVLVRSERQFRFIAEHSGGLVAIIDGGWRIRYRSVQYVEYFNPNRVEPEADWLTLVDEADRERAAEFLRYAIQTETRDSIRFHMQSAAGERMLMECNASFLSNEFGGDTRMLLITCRRLEADESVADPSRDRRYQRSGVDALVISDAAGHAEYADAGYSRLTGFTTQQIVGRMSTELRSSAGANDLFAQVLRALARDGQWEGRCLERRSNGSVFLVGVRVVGVGAQPDSVTRLVWMITDLTQENYQTGNRGEACDSAAAPAVGSVHPEGKPEVA